MSGNKKPVMVLERAKGYGFGILNDLVGFRQQVQRILDQAKFNVHTALQDDCPEDVRKRVLEEALDCLKQVAGD